MRSFAGGVARKGSSQGTYEVSVPVSSRATVTSAPVATPSTSPSGEHVELLQYFSSALARSTRQNWRVEPVNSLKPLFGSALPICCG